MEMQRQSNLTRDLAPLAFRSLTHKNLELCLLTATAPRFSVFNLLMLRKTVQRYFKLHRMNFRLVK